MPIEVPLRGRTKAKSIADADYSGKSDDEIWAVVAFVTALPAMSAQDFRIRTAQPGAPALAQGAPKLAVEYVLNGWPADESVFADADAVVNKILTYQNTPPAPPGDSFYSTATVTGYFQPAMHCVLNEGASGTPNCNAEAPPDSNTTRRPSGWRATA